MKNFSVFLKVLIEVILPFIRFSKLFGNVRNKKLELYVEQSFTKLESTNTNKPQLSHYYIVYTVVIFNDQMTQVNKALFFSAKTTAKQVGYM